MKQKCQHIETGHIGILIDHLKGTDRFPDQYGIYWEGRFDIKEGILNYWQNTTDIILLTNAL
jgi:hypothetical protein